MAIPQTDIIMSSGQNLQLYNEIFIKQLKMKTHRGTALSNVYSGFRQCLNAARLLKPHREKTV